MKVWLLQRAEPTPHDGDGVQRAMRTGILADMLARAGHQVLWWTSTFDHYSRRQRFQNDERKSVRPGYEIQYLHGCGYRKSVSVARMRENALIAQRFRRLASQEAAQPDIILASIPTAELAVEAVSYGKREGIRVVLDIRDLWPDVFLDLVPSPLRSVVGLCSRRIDYRTSKACSGADAIIGLTDAFVDWGVQRAGRSRSQDDRVFPMAYLVEELPEVRLESARRFWRERGVRRDAGQLVVSFFGALGKTNNLLPVIEAATTLGGRRLPIRFVICGAGEKAEEIKALTAHADNVDFAGWVDSDQIRALLAQTSVGIAPYIDSPNYIHNIPNKPAEYLSGGAAVALSLNRGPLYDLLLAHDCGFSYDGSSAKLAGELEFLLDNPERLKALRANALTVFRDRFDGEEVYSGLIEYLEQMAGSKPSLKSSAVNDSIG